VSADHQLAESAIASAAPRQLRHQRAQKQQPGAKAEVRAFERQYPFRRRWSPQDDHATDDDYKSGRTSTADAFNDGETDVASLGAGGTASFEETRGGVTHRTIADRNGKLERRHFVDAMNSRSMPPAAPGSPAAAGADPRIRSRRRSGAQRLYLPRRSVPTKSGASIRLQRHLPRFARPRSADVGATRPGIEDAGAASSDYERHQMLSRSSSQPLSAAQR
jgi:hypothetical protein